MYAFNPNLSDDENVRELLIYSGYPEELIQHCKPSKFNLTPNTKLSNVDMVFTGPLARALGTTEGNHDYDRVLPMLEKDLKDTNNKDREFPFEESTLTINELRKSIAELPYFRMNNRFDNIEIVGNENLKLGLLDAKVTLHEENNCQYGSQNIKAYSVFDLKAKAKKEYVIPAFFPLHNDDESNKEKTFEIAKKDLTKSPLYSVSITGVTNEQEMLKKISKKSVGNVPTLVGNTYVQLVNDNSTNSTFLNEEVDSTITVTEGGVKMNVIEMVNNTFTDPVAAKNKGLINDFKTAVNKISLEEHLRLHQLTNDQDKWMNLTFEGEEVLWDGISTAGLKEDDFYYVDKLKENSMVFFAEVITENYESVSNLAKVQEMLKTVLGSCRGLKLNLELLVNEDLEKHYLLFNILPDPKHNTELLKYTSGDIKFLVIVADGNPPVFPKPEVKLKGFGMIQG